MLETDKFGGRKWPGEVLRLAMLMTHYREPIDFSVRRLEEAEKILFRWADQMMEVNKLFGSELAGQVAHMLGDAPLLNDLRISPIIADLHRLGESGAKGNRDDAMSFFVTLRILGFESIDYLSQSVADMGLMADGDQDAATNDKITQRLAHIADKDWASADAIRDELLAQGIQLKDGKNPDTGERITTWEVKR